MQQLRSGPSLIVDVIGNDGPMRPPDLIVYANRPELWWDANNHSYVVKGPAPELVAAEAVCHLLAQSVGLPVPEFRLARLPGGKIHFASCLVEEAFRDASFRLPPHSDEANDLLAKIIVFDCWVANVDRNPGNLLATSQQPLLAIDFERAQAVRDKHPLIATSAIDCPRFWPTGEMGTALQRRLSLPTSFLASCTQLRDGDVEHAVGTVASAVPGFTWHDAVVACLQRRRDLLAGIAKAAWK